MLSDERLRRWLVGILCALLSTIPCWLVMFPPVTDLPQHIAQVRLWFEWLHDPNGIYEYHWYTPYGLFHCIAVGLWTFLSPLDVGRTMVALICAMWVGSIHVLAAWRKRPIISAVLASALVFNSSLYWGFLPFMLGFPVFSAWMVVTAEGWRGRVSPQRLVWHLLLVLLLYFTHMLWVAAAVLWLLILSISNRRKKVQILTRFLSVLPAVIGILVFYPSLSERGFDSPAYWFVFPLFRLFFTWLAESALGGLKGPTEFVMFGFIIVWLGLGLLSRISTGVRTHTERLFVLAAGMFVILALLLPDKYQNTIYLAARWLPIGMILVLLALPKPSWRWLSIAAAAVTFGFLLSTVFSWLTFEVEDRSGLRDAIERTPENQRVIGLSYIQHSHTIRGKPNIQAFAYVQVVRGGSLNFSFAQFAPMPVVYRSPRRTPWTHGLEWFPNHFRIEDAFYFNYLLLNGSQDIHRYFSVDPHFEPVTQKGLWRLYRIDHSKFNHH